MNIPDNRFCPVSRREFLKSTLTAASALAFPAVLRSQGGVSPNEKLNVAFVGVGGRGRAAIAGLAGENFLAFCDVDDERAAPVYEEYPDVPRFRDYREMFARYGDRIDAVTVSTPDHMHFAPAMEAIRMGKHLFVEKPLTHTVDEARRLTRAARERGVVTQMGNQGRATDGPRVLKEWVDSGVLGEIRKVHSWTNRAISHWPQGFAAQPDHSKFIPVVPSTLDWNLWLGIAPERPYDPAYVPFKWRGWWDFGTGALGDMGCHVMDGAFYALGLTEPTRIEAVSTEGSKESPPEQAMITYHFPARGSLPALEYVWFDGGLLPPRPAGLEDDRELPDSGTLIYGSEATVLCNTYYGSVRIIPEERMRHMAPTLPPRSVPRVEGGHFEEWLRACRGGPMPGSNFEYAGALTSMVLLGNLSLHSRRRPIDWDARSGRITNFPEYNRYLAKEYRPGWIA